MTLATLKRLPLISQNKTPASALSFCFTADGGTSIAIQVQQETLFELILAANYMDIKPLLDLTCATVASMIKVRTNRHSALACN